MIDNFFSKTGFIFYLLSTWR